MVKQSDDGPGRRKAVNLPAIQSADIDLDHIVEGHTEGGPRAGTAKTLFPSGWTKDDIERAVLAAYSAGKRVGTQGSRVKVVGDSGGITIVMWVNIESRRIETAYPERT
jgi:hypothetical protein